MKSLAIRAATVIIAIFFVLYVGYQAVRYFNNPYKTEVVFRTSVEETIIADGVAIRDEWVLEKAPYSSVNFQFENGAKVKKNAKVADYYDNDQTVQSLKKIALLEETLEKLEEIEKQTGGYVLEANILNSQISNALVEYLDICDEHFTSGLYSAKNDLLYAINKRITQIDESVSFSERISLLKEEIKNEKAKCSSPLGSIYTSKSGHFVNFTDGYEEVLTKTNYKELSVSELLSYINGETTPKNNSSSSKIIVSPQWYLAVSIDKETASKFNVSRQVNIFFPFKDTEQAEATVEDVMYDESSNKAVAILKVSNVSKSLAEMRNCTVQIVFKTTTGLRLNKNAVRFNEDNVQGVYVLNGTQILFKKIDIIYDAGSYYLTKYNESDSEYLRLYDDVVIEGKNLYDKKTFN